MLPLLTSDFLEILTLAAIAMAGDDQANGMAFTVACHDLAGKEPPDFGRLADANLHYRCLWVPFQARPRMTL